MGGRRKSASRTRKNLDGPPSAESDGNAKTTITLSINSGILEKVRDEARQRAQSLNALVNKILEKYVILYGPAEQERSMIVPNKTMRFFLANIDEQKLADDYTNFILDYVQSYYIARKIPITLENLIKYCYKVLAISGGSFHEFTNYVDEDGYMQLVFIHNYGMVWSRIMSYGFSRQLEDHLGLEVEKELFENSVVLKIARWEPKT